MCRRAITALDVDGESLPTEFLLFAKGTNPSVTGPALWNQAAANAVMQLVKERGRVDYMIDLEHRSLDKKAVALTKDATDAMGWFNVALKDGDLWAVNVRWTPEGEERLRAKKQRYTSPAFYWLDEEGGEVGELVNAALCSMPATNDQQALVAASRQSVDREMAYLRALGWCAKVGVQVPKMLADVARLKRSATGDK